jgi:peptide/nickel transport system ATP-binding protein
VSTLTINNLVVRFGAVTAVDDVSLEVPAGAVVGLVGESGSGKSTLARAVVGLAPVTSGEIRLDGVPIHTAGRAMRARLQLVFQDPYASLDPRRTVGDSIAEGLSGSRAGRRREVRSLLELVRLDPEHDRSYPRQLSGGQRQRVALARALAARPDVLVADEITSALDVSVQGAVLNLVREIQRETGVSVLFISHNLAVVRYLADTIAVMHRGRLVEKATTEEITSRPKAPYTRELLAAVPNIAGGRG